MANLFNHRPRLQAYAHAFLGSAALLHFLYRFTYFFGTGGKESMTPGVSTALMLLVHVALHASSFVFHVPEQRNATKPMIWREMRIHNAIFAGRNLIGAALGVWAPEWWWRGELGASALAAKVCLVLGTCFLADIAERNAEPGTIALMPFPKSAGSNLEKEVKMFYAKSQFAATVLAVFGQPTLSLCSLLGIEGASFLMTLTRKGIIDSGHWHVLYFLSLFIMGPALFVSTLHADPVRGQAGFRLVFAFFVAQKLRITYRQSKFLAWAAGLILGGWAAASAVMWAFPDHILYIAVTGMILATCDFLMPFVLVH